MKKRTWILFLTGTGWAVMMSLLVQREVLPYFEFQAPPSYRTWLAKKDRAEATRYRIYQADHNVGQMETLVLPNEDGSAHMESRLQFQMMGQEIVMSTEVEIDQGQQLKSFQMNGKFATLPIWIQATRFGRKLKVAYNLSFLKKGKEEIDFPRDTMLTGGFMPVLDGGNLDVGKKWRVKSLPIGEMLGGQNMGAFASSDLYATVEARREIRFQGKDLPAYEVVIRKGPAEDARISHRIFIGEDGTPLRTVFKTGKTEYEIRLDHVQQMTPADAKNWEWNVKKK